MHAFRENRKAYLVFGLILLFISSGKRMLPQLQLPRHGETFSAIEMCKEYSMAQLESTGIILFRDDFA